MSFSRTLLRTNIPRSVRLLSTTPILAMPSSNENALNRAGLTPEQSKALPRREPTADESKILSSIKEMYSCNPSNSTYDILAEDAVFHDPVGFAEGKGSFRAQFDSLPRLFKGKADIDKFEVLEAPNGGNLNTILVNQDVSYHLKERPSDVTKTMNSLLTIERNGEGKVSRMTEEWDHKKETDATDGFFGQLGEWRKKATAAMTAAYIGKGDK